MFSSPGSPPANNYFGTYFSPSNLSHHQPTPPPAGHYIHQTPGRPLYSSSSPPYISPTRHARFSSSRKSDDFEPMSTSPTPATHLHSSNSTASFLPAFLTGEAHSSGLHAGSRSPDARRRLAVTFDPSVIFDTSKSKGSDDADTGAGEQGAGNIKTGPPVSGLGGKDTSPQSGSGVFTPTGAVVGTLLATSGTSPGDETTVWVTVFGFPSSSASYVLHQFSQYGTILESKSNPGANWTHLKYSNTIQARRALNKNGTILAGGTMMVGVVPCESPEHSFPQTEPAPSKTNLYTLTPSMPTRVVPNAASAAQKIDPAIKERIRSLGTNHKLTSPEVHLPRQNNGVVNTALEWLFGW